MIYNAKILCVNDKLILVVPIDLQYGLLLFISNM